VRDPEKQRAAAQKHYAANREKMIARAAAGKITQLLAVQALIRDHLLANPCVDCGEADLIVLEFDHRCDKSFNIGEAAARGFGLSRIASEILKCDVRCANCHRRKTYRERGSKHRG
jgi:hypothetical protein